ncbi:MAG: 3-isopropylmalate dehydrogenase [Oscillospiraceae bacterium]|nr:3-isopropylmalate dehydrogenase [Oscillospiraceae bacterium]
MIRIGVLPGDYIGPEITGEAIKTLNTIKKKYGYEFELVHIEASGEAYDKYGEVLPQISIDKCKDCDVLLKGPFGGPTELASDPKWRDVERGAILPLRKIFDLYTNLRYLKTIPALLDFSNIKREVIDGADILIVRELVSGIYFGERGERQTEFGRERWDVERYNEFEICRIAKKAFEFAAKRNKKVTLIGKSNVLTTSVLWREVTEKVASDHPEIALDYMHVDNASMQLILNPKQFDVILTTNMFGDILSDEASVLSGSIGLFPSASLGEGKFGLYEPIHGSAPSIAGKNIANPISSILCLSLMFEYSLDRPDIAQDIENAVNCALNQGYRTLDIKTPAASGGTLFTKEGRGNNQCRELNEAPFPRSGNKGGGTKCRGIVVPQKIVGTVEMGEAIRGNIQK